MIIWMTFSGSPKRGECANKKNWTKVYHEILMVRMSEQMTKHRRNSIEYRTIDFFSKFVFFHISFLDLGLWNHMKYVSPHLSLDLLVGRWGTMTICLPMYFLFNLMHIFLLILQLLSTIYSKFENIFCTAKS